MTSEQHGLRERKKDGTRRALVQAAYRLVVDRRMDGFTVADIADAAGVSRRTFSNYFASKADCVVAAQADRAAELIAEVDGHPGEPLADTVHRMLHRIATQYADEEWADFETLVQSDAELRGASLALDAEVGSAVAAAAARRLGIGDDDIAAAVVGAAAMVACRMAVTRWLDSERSGGIDRLTELLQRAFVVLDPSALEALGRSALTSAR